jgi:hypothetical protein
MRSKVLILASFTILAFLAIIALAVNWDNPETQSVDEMLSSGEVPTYTLNPGELPISARESRRLIESASQTQEKPEIPQVSKVPAAESVPTVKGTWSFQLLGESPRDVSITLFQSGNAIFGAGTLSQGKTLLEAAASGSVNGDQMSLDITSLKSITLYRTTLILNGNAASGSYQAFSAAGDAWKGDVTGRYNVPQDDAGQLKQA